MRHAVGVLSTAADLSLCGTPRRHRAAMLPPTHSSEIARGCRRGRYDTNLIVASESEMIGAAFEARRTVRKTKSTARFEEAVHGDDVE